MTGASGLHRVLLGTLGLSGAVVTETLWALHRANRADWPNEIRLLATAKARARFRSQISEKVAALSDALGEPAPLIRFLVAPDAAGEDLDDIRRLDDAVAFGDLAAEHIREITEEPDTQLHLSIAGGRKTMSYHAGAAMTIYGREQDRLSHVLVDPIEFETAGFWWPDQPDRWIETRQGRLDAREARLDLLDIPFVRLRSLIPEADLSRPLSYGQIVSVAISAAKREPVRLVTATHSIEYGKFSCVIEPRLFALYYLVAERKVEGRSPLRIKDFHRPMSEPLRRFMEIYAGVSEAGCVKLKDELDEFDSDVELYSNVQDRFRPTVSKLKKRLATLDVPAHIRDRMMVDLGKSVLSIDLAPEDIRLVDD